MDNFISRSKYVNETISIVVDFADDLLPAETLISVTVTVSLFSGTDSNPQNLLFQGAVITGSKCDQKIRLGLPGCIYTIIFAATTSAGTNPEKVCELAILPQDGNAIPSYTVIYETTCLYPIQSFESYQHSLTFESLSLDNKLYAAGAENYQHFLTWNSMTLVGGTITYNNPPDDLQHTLNWLTMSLVGGPVTYNAPPEDIKHSFAWLTMILVGNLITYNNPTENIQHTLSWNTMTLL